VFEGDAGSLARAGAELSLGELLGPEGDGVREIRIRLSGVEPGATQPVYFSATVHEVPRVRPVTPDIAGLAVERWYERLDVVSWGGAAPLPHLTPSAGLHREVRGEKATLGAPEPRAGLGERAKERRRQLEKRRKSQSIGQTSSSIRETLGST
jgi:hypothetical protein